MIIDAIKQLENKLDGYARPPIPPSPPSEPRIHLKGRSLYPVECLRCHHTHAGLNDGDRLWRYPGEFLGCDRDWRCARCHQVIAEEVGL
jgi:hypothetical protein